MNNTIIGIGIIVIAVAFIIIRYYRIFTKKQSPCDGCGKTSCNTSSSKTSSSCSCGCCDKTNGEKNE